MNPEGTAALDLTEWGRTWLQTVGCNELRSTFTQNNGQFDQFTIV